MDGLYIALAGVAGAGVGAAVGAVVAWLIAERRGRAALAAAETARAVTEQRAAGLEAELARQAGERANLIQQHAASLQQREATIEELRQRAGTAEKAQAAAAAALQAGQQALEEKRQLLTNTEAELERLRAEAIAAKNQHTAASEALKASQENIAEQRKLIDDANQRLSAAFAEVSRGALERAGATFFEMAKAKFETLSAEAGGDLEQRKEQIATLLKPMQEILAGYQKRLAEIEASRATAYGDLLRQIGGMSETQRLLATQTTNLASALKKSNVRGRWGEIALERLVELAGMTEHVDFSQQESLRSEEGLLRPDMVVKFAGNRQVVIDSKAVMAAFLEAAGATDEAAREAHLRLHAQYVRSRVNDLSSKAYWSQFKVMPEFTVLFLPGESFLYAACDHDPELIQYALDRKVLLATPTTLIALLRTVELGWRQEEVSQNAERIRTLGVEIYDRLAVLADHLTRLGSSLGSAVDNYNKVVGTVEGRVLVSARKMGELGARNEKTIETVEAVEKRPREFSEALHPEKSPLLPG
jgi:DNA recombination protein RmuC